MISSALWFHTVRSSKLFIVIEILLHQRVLVGEITTAGAVSDGERKLDEADEDELK